MISHTVIWAKHTPTKTPSPNAVFRSSLLVQNGRPINPEALSLVMIYSIAALKQQGNRMERSPQGEILDANCWLLYIPDFIKVNISDGTPQRVVVEEHTQTHTVCV